MRLLIVSSYIPTYFLIFISVGWLSHIEKGNLLQTFDSWGPEFEIQFNIIVNDLSFDYWANVFRFTTRNNNTGCDVVTYLDAGCTGKKHTFYKHM